MPDYDKMSVEELIGVAADYRGMAVTMDRFIVPALRRAVIREDIVHCGDCRYAKWETQAPWGTGEGIACYVIAGRSRPWLGSVDDYCSEGRRKEKP